MPRRQKQVQRGPSEVSEVQTRSTEISNIAERAAGRPAALVVIYGPDVGRKIDVRGRALSIGRSSACDIPLELKSVSRRHAEVTTRGERVFLRDGGSTNGTYLNDGRVDEAELRNGDLIKIGRVIFRFIAGSNIESLYAEEVYRLKSVDGLTQVFNRRHFLDALEREISRCQRHHRDLALLLIDADRFKEINDRFGHVAGDAVLKEVASVMKRLIRREDVLARYGGEEFALILPEAGGGLALRTAEKIRKKISSRRFRHDGRAISLSVSIGIAPLGDRAKSATELIARADEKLYEAKRKGGNLCRL